MRSLTADRAASDRRDETISATAEWAPYPARGWNGARPSKQVEERDTGSRPVSCLTRCSCRGPALLPSDCAPQECERMMCLPRFASEISSRCFACLNFRVGRYVCQGSADTVAGTVNIPFDKERLVCRVGTAPTGRCIMHRDGSEAAIATLKESDRTDRQRRRALRLVVHFMAEHASAFCIVDRATRAGTAPSSGSLAANQHADLLWIFGLLDRASYDWASTLARHYVGSERPISTRSVQGAVEDLDRRVPSHRSRDLSGGWVSATLAKRTSALSADYLSAACRASLRLRRVLESALAGS
jgi:hypothetical protein